MVIKASCRYFFWKVHFNKVLFSEGTNGEEVVCTTEFSARAFSFSKHEINHLSRLWESELVTEKSSVYKQVNNSLCVIVELKKSAFKKPPLLLSEWMSLYSGTGRVLCFQPLLAAIYVWEQEVAARSVGEATVWYHRSPKKPLNFVNLNNLCLEMHSQNQHRIATHTQNIW